MTRENPNEGDVKRKVKAILTKHAFFFFMPSANGFGINGVSDIIAVMNGRIFCIETKLKKGTGSVLQERFGAQIETAGGVYKVVNMKMVDSGEFELWLTSLT